MTWEQRALSGDPKFMGSQHIPDMPYAEYARLIGLEGVAEFYEAIPGRSR